MVPTPVPLAIGGASGRVAHGPKERVYCNVRNQRPVTGANLGSRCSRPVLIAVRLQRMWRYPPPNCPLKLAKSVREENLDGEKIHQKSAAEGGRRNFFGFGPKIWNLIIESFPKIPLSGVRNSDTPPILEIPPPNCPPPKLAKRGSEAARRAANLGGGEGT